VDTSAISIAIMKVSLNRNICRRTCAAIALCLLAFAYVSSSDAADLVYICPRSNRAPAALEQIQAAVNYYGLNLKVITVHSNADNPSIQKAVKIANAVGVVVHADLLSVIQYRALRRSLMRTGRGRIPLLIIGAGPDTNPLLLKQWLLGVAVKCAWTAPLSDAYHEFGNVEGITSQLSGVDIPYPEKRSIYIAIDKNGSALRIESIRDRDRTYPVFIVKERSHQKVFLASGPFQENGATYPGSGTNEFAKIAPLMMFIRYCSGERGWHALHYYANFTIDDPWLRQPYGYLDYAALLTEMNKHHFHTTIAFVPWNYDRSWPEVVSIFRNNPDKYSIVIHGNNHDHKEFTNYRKKSFDHQVANLKQALIRMDKFQDLTGIAYDKVMIFPHSIAPEKTIGALKKYNYLATVNSLNYPMDTIPIANKPEDLRTVTMSFEGFSSVQRISTDAQITDAYIAINQFLGNPLLFYNHAEYFSKGINAFDSIADRVNKREPTTKWSGLGNIARHLYAVKLRDDSNYDVLAFSNNICLDNSINRKIVYYIQKEESGGQEIQSVTVDGESHTYMYQAGKILLSVLIQPESTRCVSIQYANDLKSWAGETGHDSVAVSLLRWGSDLRDIYLIKTRLGIAAIQFYQVNHLSPIVFISIMLILLTVMIYLIYCLWMSAKRGYTRVKC